MSKMDQKFKDLIANSSKSEGDDFESVTFRPSPKVAAMMEAVLNFSDEPASTVFTDMISEQLATHCLEFADFSSCILGAFKEFYEQERYADPSPDSALGIMVERGFVSFEHTNAEKERRRAEIKKALKFGK